MDPIGAFLGWQLRRAATPQKKLNWAKRLAPWPYRSVRSVYGPILCNAGNDRTYLKSISGRYGQFIPDILKAHQRPYTFVDIGANTGIFSLVAARQANCRQVYAFEPNPEVYARLVCAIQRNDANITAFQLAISAQGRRIARLSVPDGHSGMGSLEVPSDRTFQVATVDRSFLDGLANEDDNADVIAKIDVEGHELVVLEELFASRLAPRVTDLIIECAEEHQPGGLGAIIDRLHEVGFHQQGRKNSPTYHDAHFCRQRA